MTRWASPAAMVAFGGVAAAGCHPQAFTVLALGAMLAHAVGVRRSC